MKGEPGNIDQPLPESAEAHAFREALEAYLSVQLPGFKAPVAIRRFPGGYSNLTYLLQWEGGECVMRTPPPGAEIRSAHDMDREYRVLEALKPFFPSIPTPIHNCRDAGVIGLPFYLMQRVRGTILRNRIPEGMDASPERIRSICLSAIDTLANLHSVDVSSTGLSALGKPEGYVRRQVLGWIDRYARAKTDEVRGMEIAADWMSRNIPTREDASFIHNDFKLDNLVLDPVDREGIVAVLDWEMATVGDRFMDLGTTLAYWCEADDDPALKPFNLTWLPGAPTRREVLGRYADTAGVEMPDMLFYYVFGCFKVGVIVQQIHARYRKGVATDKRFAMLGTVLQACASNAEKALQRQGIG